MSIADRYPPMDPESCMSIGMNGGCGSDCPLFRSGQCEEPHQTLEGINKNPHEYDLTKADVDEFNDMYNYVWIKPKPKTHDAFDKTYKGLW